jgi:hypothetical protein
MNKKFGPRWGLGFAIALVACSFPEGDLIRAGGRDSGVAMDGALQGVDGWAAMLDGAGLDTAQDTVGIDDWIGTVGDVDVVGTPDAQPDLPLLPPTDVANDTSKDTHVGETTGPEPAGEFGSERGAEPSPDAGADGPEVGIRVDTSPDTRGCRTLIATGLLPYNPPPGSMPLNSQYLMASCNSDEMARDSEASCTAEGGTPRGFDNGNTTYTCLLPTCELTTGCSITMQLLCCPAPP